jgi:hypothetical protein
VIAGLILALLIPLTTAAQEVETRAPQDEEAYQALWCLYLTAHPYFLDAPSDVDCGSEPRAMTTEEAAAHLLGSMGPLVEVMDRWDCADSRAKGGMTWYYERMWARRSQEADRQWGDALAAVRWPDDAAKNAARLIEDLYTEADLREAAYRYDTFTESLSSGAWSRSLMATDQRGETAEELRLRLGFAQPPRTQDACQAIRRRERQEAESPLFDNPMAGTELESITGMLAEAGLLESVTDESGAPRVQLTQDGLPIARALVTLDDATTDGDVLAALIATAEDGASTVEPTSAPSTAEPGQSGAPEPDEG